MCPVYYTTKERLHNYINDARLFYPWAAHANKFTTHLFMPKAQKDEKLVFKSSSRKYRPT